MKPNAQLYRKSWTALAASFVVVAALALPGRAGAATYTMSVFPPDPATGFYSTAQFVSPLLPVNSSFTDIWSFSVSSASNFQIASITDYFVHDIPNISATLLGTGYGGLPFGNPNASGTLLPATTYNLQITGTTLNGPWPYAQYGGHLNLVPTAMAPTTPIPEPETYAMMLAGLGLMGLVARRRKQKDAA